MLAEQWLRTIKLSLGVAGASALWLIGFWGWRAAHEGVWPWDHAMALIPLSAGWLLWMMMVADDVCPEASIGVTGCAKITVVLVLGGSLGVTAGRLWW